MYRARVFVLSRSCSGAQLLPVAHVSEPFRRSQGLCPVRFLFSSFFFLFSSFLLRFLSSFFFFSIFLFPTLLVRQTAVLPGFVVLLASFDHPSNPRSVGGLCARLSAVFSQGF